MSEWEDHKNQIPVSENKEKANQFPAGLRVLAIDDNVVCLRLLSAILKKCHYEVTAITEATEALDKLRNNKDNYDIVITDVKRLDMDGFKLLEIIGLEMDIPVILTSADDGTRSVMEGIRHGARDYLVKPVCLKEIQNIWQHVIRKQYIQSSTAQVGNNQNLEPPTKREGDNTFKEQEVEPKANPKRKRVAWTTQMHNKFLDAVQFLGLEKAFPKKILEIMNEPGLSRENVASHLQKYRNAFKKDKLKASNMIKEQEKAVKNLSCSSISSSSNQGITCLNYQNRLAEHGINNAKINTFGANIRSNFNTVKPQNTMPQNNLQFPQMGNQISPIWHNPAVGSGHLNPILRQNCEMNGMRFPSIYSGQKMANECFVPFSSSHDRFNSNNGGPLQMPSSSQLTPLPQPNSLPMVAPVSSYVQHDGRNLIPFSGRPEPDGSPFDMRGQSIDYSNWNCPIPQQTFQNSEIESNLTFSSLEDDLTVMVNQFNNNSVPKL